MLTRIISLVTLVAFLIMTTGCTKITNIPITEAVGPVVEIVGITLLTGEKITFSDKGCRYNKDFMIFSGVTPEGKTIVYELKEIQSLQYKYPVNGSDLVMTIDAKGVRQYSKNMELTHITGVVTDSGEIIKFTGNSGVIDDEYHLIRGAKKDGIHVEVPFDEIRSVQVKKIKTASPIKVLFTVAGCVMLICGVIDYAENGPLGDWD